MEKNEIELKILGLGDSSVGQICIFERYTENKFRENTLITIGIDFKRKNINLAKWKIKLQIWDTAGQKRFRDGLKQFFKDRPDAIILIYDIKDNCSYDNLNDWVKFIKDCLEENTIKIPVILVGNKIDSEDLREVTREQGNKFAKENGFLFIECSAKAGENINYIFNKVVLTILEKNPKYEELKKEFKDKVGKEIEEVEEKYIKYLKILKKYISFWKIVNFQL